MVSNPEYLNSGLGQLERIEECHRLLKRIGIDPLSPLKTCCIISVLGIISAIVLSIWFAKQVFGWMIALLSFLFIFLNPYIALARLLHLDGMVNS